nr:DciA family protein [uncultured Pseudomonas sp.]
MAYKPSPALPPAVLLRQARPLRRLLSQAERIAHLQRLLESQLQPAARAHCHIASWRDGVLLLIVTDGHWATRLRYQQKRLQRQLQALEAFANLNRILFKVQPPLVPARRQGQGPELSSDAAESIRGSAEGIVDPKLRAALERLAAHGPRKD